MSRHCAVHPRYVSARYIEQDTSTANAMCKYPDSGVSRGCRTVYALLNGAPDQQADGGLRTMPGADQPRSPPAADRVTRLARMPRQRQVIDYALARRATLADLAQRPAEPPQTPATRTRICCGRPAITVRSPRRGVRSAARNRLTRVTYAYGDELQHASGRARSSRSLDALAARFAQLRIYVVEVCRSCGWNHLCVSFMIGTDVHGRRARLRQAVRRRRVPDVVPGHSTRGSARAAAYRPPIAGKGASR